MTRVIAVLPAAGVGMRIGGPAKQFRAIAGRPVLEYALEALAADERVAGFVIVLGAGADRPGDWTVPSDRPLVVAAGGRRRADSVRAGLIEAGRAFPAVDHVAVHDAARPCLHSDDLAAVLDVGLAVPEGAILARPPSDTVKSGATNIASTLNRDSLWLAQTPQVFLRTALLDALSRCLDRGLAVTDEASAMEHAGYAPRLIRASHPNPKITWPEDLMLAEQLLHDRTVAP